MSTRDIHESRLLIATLLLVSTLTIMADAILTPALPVMRAAFAGTANVALLVRLVVTMPAIAVAVTAPLSGRLVDRVGRKPVVLTGVVIYAVAGSAGYVLDSLVAILISRLILGIGVGALLTTATTLIADYFDDEQRDTVMGWQGATCPPAREIEAHEEEHEHQQTVSDPPSPVGVGQYIHIRLT